MLNCWCYVEDSNSPPPCFPMLIKTSYIKILMEFLMNLNERMSRIHNQFLLCKCVVSSYCFGTTFFRHFFYYLITDILIKIRWNFLCKHNGVKRKQHICTIKIGCHNYGSICSLRVKIPLSVVPVSPTLMQI